MGEATKEAMDAAIESMTTLNKYAAQCCKKYDIHGCTDITGFGFLGHLHEMVDGKLSCRVYADQMPVFPEALEYADAFLLTAVGQQNRNHAGRHIRFDDCISFAMQEVLFDPQSSGGLMIVLPADQAESLLADIQALGVPAAIVGEMLEPSNMSPAVSARSMRIFAPFANDRFSAWNVPTSPAASPGASAPDTISVPFTTEPQPETTPTRPLAAEAHSKTLTMCWCSARTNWSILS